jgi:hypothetical protein
MIGQREQAAKLQRPFSGRNGPPKALEKACPALDVVVMFTDVPGTLIALKAAAELAHGLNGRIRLLAAQVVPYPLPLESPQVSKEFNERRFQTIASHSRIETRVEVYVCRDREDAFCQALQAEALVVIGVHRSWRPTREKALARKLQKKGHQVIFVDSERGK